ncbi:hypothetical protein RHGRI_001851 [Rhododendron griersonianum]|uniref:Uncharacterized protein n=1 Tax=Rhododendron griersonianum TaxID=479676 RepID=A0AAV6LMY7_9ERIC|nr:hypothetical protein RHGRI_001851 [Rhododendron griersonianum]
MSPGGSRDPPGISGIFFFFWGKTFGTETWTKINPTTGDTLSKTYRSCRLRKSTFGRNQSSTDCLVCGNPRSLLCGNPRLGEINLQDFHLESVRKMKRCRQEDALNPRHLDPKSQSSRHLVFSINPWTTSRYYARSLLICKSLSLFTRFV